ncbi:MAG TPA: BON domain-containing protein [Beijerinckiaceae bacterium]
MGGMGGRGMAGDRDRGGAYGARSGYSGSSSDWADEWRGGRGREYDQYAGMGSEPGYAAAYGGSAAHRPGDWDSGMRSGGRFSSSDYGYGSADRHERDRHERGFWDRASDEVSSWFGDEEAERRREMDRQHAGRGPRNYTRSDDRIREDACDRLTEDASVDASDVEVIVKDREVTLNGFVGRREEKRRAEDCVERIPGVTHVQNNLRVRQPDRAVGVMGSGVATSGSDYQAVGSTSEGAGQRRTGGVGTGVGQSTGSAAAAGTSVTKAGTQAG